MSFAAAGGHFNVQNRRFGPGLASEAQLQGLIPQTGVEQSMSMGIGSMGAMGAPVGPNLQNFVSGFQHMNMNPWGAGGVSAAQVGGFGMPQNPMQNMYMARYGGQQFGGASAMTAFRGGAAGMQMNAYQRQSFQPPEWFGKQLTQRWQGGNIIKNDIVAANRDISAKVQELMAAGVDPAQIKEFVTMQRMQYIQQMVSKMTNISRWGHELSKSIIQNMRA